MNILELAKASASTWMSAPPALEDVLSSLHHTVGFELPSDYLEFLRFSNGGCGSVPVNP
jgi:hypothetical protein